MTPITVFTARYANRNVPASGLTPVRITVGRPRNIRYKVDAELLDFAPFGELFAIDDLRLFTQLYVRKVESLGRDPMEQIVELDAQMGCHGLVLLCFEDLRKREAWCHRRVLAEWLESKYGVEVPELEEAIAEQAGVPELNRHRPTWEQEMLPLVC